MVNNVNDLSTAQSDITSLQESVNTNTTSIITLQSNIASIDTPNFFWLTDPSLSGATEDIYNPILWGTIVYGNPSNLDTTTGIWTCPAAGLWQFIFSIFYENYSGYPGWNLYQNGKVVLLRLVIPFNGSLTFLMTHHLQ